ncbi:MAG: PDZ domain-containing protein [Planctomycetales bacterium]|nr:PDZ domain-containing protein [Planctomycetales bacterium]
MIHRSYMLVAVIVSMVLTADVMARPWSPQTDETTSPTTDSSLDGTASPTPAQPKPNAPTATEIAGWIEDLDADAFATRVRATRLLVRSGADAITPLTEQLPTFGREGVTRGAYILRQIAISSKEEQHRQAAVTALETLATSTLPTASRTAVSVLNDIYELWFKQAQLRLRQSGAIFTTTQILTTKNTRESYPSILFGGQWHGTIEDLALIQRVTNRPHRPTNEQYMLVFDGAQVTDEWMSAIADVPGVAVVRVTSGRITNAGIEQLVKMPDLRATELLYNEINDDCLDKLAGNAQLTRLRLIGNRISIDGAARLKQQTAAEVDFRAGGFLGVACNDNPCRITLVQTNSAAARAGFRIDDIIVSYNGTAVNSMDELIQEIAKHGVGEKVQVEIDRSGERFTRELVLGKWD